MLGGVKKKEANHYFTYIYIILYDFINCPAFVDIKLCIIKQQQSKYNQRDVYFLCIAPNLCFAFLRWIRFLVVVLDRLFFIWETKKWQPIMLDRWSCYTVTIVQGFAWVDSVLVILDKWSSYRGACLSSDFQMYNFSLLCKILGSTTT